MGWHSVCDKWNKEGYNALSDAEQIWVTTRGFIDAIENGGLISYFYNGHADNYDDAVYALGELEAFEVLDIFESFAAFFGDEVPEDINQRNAIIDSWAQGSAERNASGNVDAILMPMLRPLEEQLHTYLSENGIEPTYARDTR